jgi:hypothetical protein
MKESIFMGEPHPARVEGSTLAEGRPSKRPANMWTIRQCVSSSQVFTYFEPSLQREMQSKLADCMVPGGALVLGARETPFPGPFEPWVARACVYEKVAYRD